MALHHRKLFPQESSAPKHASSSCYFCYVCPKDCYDLVSPPPLIQPLHPQNHKKLTIILILILSVLSAAFLFLSYFTVSNHRSRRVRTPRTIGHEPYLDHPVWHVRTAGLTQSAIDSIPTLSHQKGILGKGDCSVCLNEFKENETLRLLPKCSHAFHVPCIDTWLRSHKNCPVCRGPVMSDAGDSEASLGLEGSVSTGENVIEMENSSVHAFSRSGFMEDESRVVVVSDLSDIRSGLGREFGEHVTRPVSLDFTIGSDIYRELVSRDEGCSGDKMERVDPPIFEYMTLKRGSINRTIKSSGLERSLEKMPVSMKRSFSCSGKRSFRRSGRSIESISIQEICEQNRNQV